MAADTTFLLFSCSFIWHTLLIIHRGGNRLAAVLFHDDPIAAGVVLDVVHETAHEHDAAAAGNFEPILAGAVGHGARVEARAFVLDRDPEMLGRDATRDLDVFVGIELIAVADGVDDRFFYGQVDTKDFGIGPFAGVKLVEQFLQKILARSALAFERDFGRPVSRLRHDVNSQEMKADDLES